MGLSGSDKAYQLAIAGVGRADATRSAYFLRNVTPTWLNGAARVGMIQESINIDLNTGSEPHRCSFDFKGGSGYVPVSGHTVVIGHGTTDNELFAGQLTKVVRVVARNDEKRPRYRCEALGHAFEFNSARIGRVFYAKSLSVNSAVQGALAATSPSASALGFSAPYIDATLDTVSEWSVNALEPLSEAFGRLFRGVDATWYIDHKRRIHAYNTIDPGGYPVPGTLTTSASFWDFEYAPTDLTRSYNRVWVLGAAQGTLADVDTTYHVCAPLASGSMLGTQLSAGLLENAASGFLFGLEPRLQDDGLYPPTQGFNAGNVSIFQPASRQSNTLTVAGANVSSAAPLADQRWYDVGGQAVYVASVIGVFSATVGSIAYSYHVPSSKSGALETDVLAQFNVVGLWNYKFNQSNPPIATFAPAGTEVRAVGLAIGGGAGATAYRVLDDGRLAAPGAQQVADAALARGATSETTVAQFSTRDRDFGIGQPVYLSLTSPAEPSGHSIVATLAVQDISLGEFGRLTETQGPVRTVRAAPVRRPTLWQILQGDN